MFSLLTRSLMLSMTSYDYVLYQNSNSTILTRPRLAWMEISGYSYWICKGVEIHIFSLELSQCYICFLPFGAEGP